MEEVAERLGGLWERSEFRRGIHLNGAERAELRSVGAEALAERARPLIAARLGPAAPQNDGRQTPWHGFPAFPAQHATATCCRVCLQKHHGIATGIPLTETDLDYVIACLCVFWERELGEERPCECRRCRQEPPTRRRPRSTPVAPELALGLERPVDAGGRVDVADPAETEAPRGSRTNKQAPNQPTPGTESPPGHPGAKVENLESIIEGPITTGYNDLDLRQWKAYEEIETGSLWLFGQRDRSAGHRLDYHGNFIPQIATQTLLRFSRRGEVVLDLFLGSGTAAIEALRLGRRCIGVELKPELVAAVRTKVGESDQVAVIEGDSRTQATQGEVRAQLAAWGHEQAHLLVLHPPYHDIIPFSDRPEDLSNAPDTEAYLCMFAQAARRGWELLAPGRFAVLVIGDKYARGELVPLGFRCMDVMNQVGFRTRSIVVKNIEGNEIGKGRSNNLWRYRALRGGFYLFKHEYVMIFQKQGG